MAFKKKTTLIVTLKDELASKYNEISNITAFINNLIERELDDNVNITIPRKFLKTLPYNDDDIIVLAKRLLTAYAQDEIYFKNDVTRLLDNFYNTNTNTFTSPKEVTREVHIEKTEPPKIITNNEKTKKEIVEESVIKEEVPVNTTEPVEEVEEVSVDKGNVKTISGAGNIDKANSDFFIGI